MRLSKMFFKTYRENPSDAEINSHKLLTRGGFIKKISMGIYAYMPMGVKILKKIENIVREEMNKAGAIEVVMPMLLPREVYAGRLNKFGNTMFKLVDSQNRDYCLGPTHEEVFTTTVRDFITSYKQLPVTLYQIQTKFRDELRPRFGLQRAREFIMKDGYSFDTSYDGLDISFDKMNDAYNNIFKRLELNYVPVEADNGTMGGKCSREFMVKSDVGEDELIVCEHCGYGANIEKASCKFKQDLINKKGGNYSKIYTPNLKTIDELINVLHGDIKNFLKCVVYKADDKIVAVFLRGDREIEEIKLVNHLKCLNILMASLSDIENIGSVAGFVGAKNLKNCIVLADLEVQNMSNFIMGANIIDYHYNNVNLEDCEFGQFIDLRKVQSGDECPNCGKSLGVIRGIEVGHIFKLGETYTKLLDCNYLDQNGKKMPMVMGCYGIGISRILSAIVEQNNDEYGIKFPEIIAPYKVAIVIANQKNENQVLLSEKIYNEMLTKNVEVLLDDRNESLGVKMKDIELIGIPNIIIVGRDSEINKVELINRKTNNKSIVDVPDVLKNFID